MKEQLSAGLELEHLEALLDSIRDATRARLSSESSIRGLAPAALVVGAGAGDVTYGIDLESEEVVTSWFEERARAGALSLFTEDMGWRHAGPTSDGWEELPGFDHGGPRIAIDPIDGTRPLLGDLRSAWTSIAACPPGPGEPRASDVSVGLLGELPTSSTEAWRVIRAQRGHGATIQRLSSSPAQRLSEQPLIADADDRADHGVFSFFRFSPWQRPQIAAVEADFLARIEAAEGADLMHCYDDQYVCNVGQLVHLALGAYRLIADLRGHMMEPGGESPVTSKPYDLAAALLVAREAGCVVTAPDGEALDFPLDAETPVSFIGWANEPTARRLAPHLKAALS